MWWEKVRNAGFKEWKNVHSGGQTSTKQAKYFKLEEVYVCIYIFCWFSINTCKINAQGVWLLFLTFCSIGDLGFGK